MHVLQMGEEGVTLCTVESGHHGCQGDAHRLTSPAYPCSNHDERRRALQADTHHVDSELKHAVSLGDDGVDAVGGCALAHHGLQHKRARPEEVGAGDDHCQQVERGHGRLPAWIGLGVQRVQGRSQNRSEEEHADQGVLRQVTQERRFGLCGRQEEQVLDLGNDTILDEGFALDPPYGFVNPRVLRIQHEVARAPNAARASSDRNDPVRPVHDGGHRR
mmetsp:Transcript_4787/g.16693  ORF Transcript_4787/g.16693 Transcript_4787/m.16693 type:complete len:218 (-) Transcript_4787:393-1046(-)